MIAAHSLSDFGERHDAELRLLLLTSKVTLNAQQRKEVRALCSDVTNWKMFCDIAARKFSTTYAQNALAECAPDLVPKLTLDRLKAEADRFRFRTLRVAATQVDFHRKCVEPTDADHAYLKGLALPLQFGQNFVDRFCRDIDILVASKSIRPIVNLAINNGYNVILTTSPLRFATCERDIDFVCQFEKVVYLLGPEEILIELHRRMDKGSLNYDREQALATAEEFEFSGTRMRTLSKHFHFVYCCVHHSSHFWSHLHWIADADMMIADLGTASPQIIEHAERLGIRPTVEATFAFHDLISRPGLWDSKAIATEDLGAYFLKACLINLEGGLELEKKLRKQSYSEDFISSSQVSKAKYSASGKHPWTEDIHPNLIQYLKRSYPRPLFWMYRVERVLIILRDAFYGTLGIDVPKKAGEADASRREGDPNP